MQKIMPIIVTTWKAVDAAAAESWPVIYVDAAFYSAEAAKIREHLASRQYVLSWKKGKKGVFFLLTAGENRFDQSRQEISDPLGIL